MRECLSQQIKEIALATKQKFDMSHESYEHLGMWKEGNLIDMGYKSLGEIPLGLDHEEAELFEACCDNDMDADNLGMKKEKHEKDAD